MSRRIMLVGVGLALLTLPAPVAAEAQESGKVYRIGWLTSSVSRPGGFTAALRVPPWLPELGWVEGENVVFVQRSAVGNDKRLPELAAELVRRQVDVMVADGAPAIRAAQHATKAIPIVMVSAGDPIRAGFVASLASPGGNITGVTTLAPELSGKRLELLKEAVPGLTRVAVLWNPADPDKGEEWRETQAAARALDVELQSLEVRSPREFAPAFKAAVSERAGAVLVLSDKLIGSHAYSITNLAAKSRLPAMYSSRWFVGYQFGGLMYYGLSFLDLYRSVAVYIDKLLQGAKPANLPVERPRQFELVINVKTARALNLTIPQSVLARTDTIIGE